MILLLGGTNEAGAKAEELLQRGEAFILTVTTDYGYRTFSERFGERVLKIAFTENALKAFIDEKGITAVYDCTHPYAAVITAMAKTVCQQAGIRYKNFVRETDKVNCDREGVISTPDFQSAARLIAEKKLSRVLLTIGTKHLAPFAGLSDVEIFARVLPDAASIQACLKAGVKQSNIIAVQGPFSKAFNVALIEQFKIDCLVTKNSGASGGFFEKIEACREAGIIALVVERSVN
jgi:precorrin-6A/cobalt-precorrin-6A reductase